MPPHCDSLDGPVVTAARDALDKGEVNLVLPYVPADGEPDVRKTFDLAVAVRTLGPDAREVADRWFFETVVRVHRHGEGAPFTGLKPAGLDIGPVIPASAQALETGSPGPLVKALCGTIAGQAERRLSHVTALKEHAGEGVPQAREYVEATLGLQVWAHTLYRIAVGDPHAHEPE